MQLKEEIKKIFKGEVLSDKKTLEEHSKDASLFEVIPELVVYPKKQRRYKISCLFCI